MVNMYFSDKQALNILKKDDPYHKTSVQFDEALKNAIVALEKQVSKNVIQHDNEGSDNCWFECPCCGEYIVSYWKEPEIHRCKECGQLLGWSD